MRSRSFHRATCALATAHAAFELGAGGGVPFQAQLGLRGASAFWLALSWWWLRTTRMRSARADRRLARLAGASLGGVAVHYLVWPWAVPPIPWLGHGAEGLPRRYSAPYNVLLYAWAASAAAALARETRDRRAAVAPSILALGLVAFAIHHAGWMQRQARAHPAWWNRAYVETMRDPLVRLRFPFRTAAT